MRLKCLSRHSYGLAMQSHFMWISMRSTWEVIKDSETKVYTSIQMNKKVEGSTNVSQRKRVVGGNLIKLPEKNWMSGKGIQH